MYVVGIFEITQPVSKQNDAAKYFKNADMTSRNNVCTLAQSLRGLSDFKNSNGMCICKVYAYNLMPHA